MSSSTVPAQRGAPHLDPEQLRALREQLQEQYRFRRDQLAGLRHGTEQNDEIAETLTVAARAALRDVTDALQRMDDGTYGSCVSCGAQLPAERLEVLPQVGRCVACLRAGA